MVVAGCLAFGLLLYTFLDLYQDPVEVADQPPTPSATPIVLIASLTPSPTANLPTNTATPPPTETELPTLTPLPSPTKRPLRVPREVGQQPITALDWASLEAFWSADFPPNDFFEVAQRFGFDDVGERTIVSQPFQVGDTETFILPEFDIEAEVVAVTDNAYFWIETGFDYDSATLQRVTDRLESEFYPQLTDLFGTEWRPGVDNDPRISLVHLASLDGYSELGFFDSVNQYPRAIDSLSNQREMVVLNLSELELGSALYYGTLVHELQHLIQWNMDANETVWLDEGMAQLAEIYLGFQTAESIDYLADPSLQLNTWSYDDDAVYGHYGASYLFVTYLWEVLGDDAIRALARDPANGISSVRRILQQYRADLTLEQLLADWTVANLLDERDIDPRYGYRSFRVGLPEREERVRRLPMEYIYEIPQYGVHYIDLRATGVYTLTFAGATTVPLLPPNAPTERVWFVPPVNDANAQLTRPVDLSNVGEATLHFDAWYDLEEDFDFGYVSVSADNGLTWEIQTPDRLAAGNYGPAISGSSADARRNNEGWVAESIPLNRYVGQEILLRFELLTDSAILGDGLALTNITIPEINFQDGGEGWLPVGFVHTTPQLPQQWSLQLVQNKSVIPIPLNDLNQAQWPLTIDRAGATLIIMPQTPFTDLSAMYWLRLSE